MMRNLNAWKDSNGLVYNSNTLLLSVFLCITLSQYKLKCILISFCSLVSHSARRIHRSISKVLAAVITSKHAFSQPKPKKRPNKK